MSRNFGTIFLPPAPKLCNNVDKKKTDEKVGITRIRNELSFFVDFIDVLMPANHSVTHKLNIKTFGLYSVCE